MELGFHLLRRAGYDEPFIAETARIMEYARAYELYRPDLELPPTAGQPARLHRQARAFSHGHDRPHA
jgi:hypothetical protein